MQSSGSTRKSRAPDKQPNTTSSASATLREAGGYLGVHSSFVFQNIVITLWFDAATMESLVVFERECRAICVEHPEGISAVHIMMPGGTALPSAPTRVELARVASELSQFTAAGAVLIPGSGFWASALRSLITACMMLAPRKLHLQTFGDLEILAQWLAPLHSARTGVQIEPGELHAALLAAQSARRQVAA